jgi:hypothetical protein
MQILSFALSKYYLYNPQTHKNLYVLNPVFSSRIPTSTNAFNKPFAVAVETSKFRIQV